MLESSEQNPFDTDIATQRVAAREHRVESGRLFLLMIARQVRNRDFTF
ncbi:TPA: hypothetical protein I8Y04_004895 [Raoultella planticola]|nr:hypothetical protein [Raoultella planticola]HAT1623125.1 hypothetical protein [Raoultella planticola]